MKKLFIIKIIQIVIIVSINLNLFALAPGTGNELLSIYNELEKRSDRRLSGDVIFLDLVDLISSMVVYDPNHVDILNFVFKNGESIEPERHI